MRNAALSLGCLCMVACGGTSPREDDPAKAESAAAEPGGGGETTRASRPARAGDLTLSVHGDSPIGSIDADRLGAYSVSVEIQNQSDTPLRMGRTVADVSVMRGTTTVEGCRATSDLEVPEVLAPNGTAVAEANLPCALGEGRYSVIVLVSPDAHVESVAPAGPGRAASMALVIDDDLAPVGTPSLAPAEMDSPGGDGLLPEPVPGDLLPPPAIQ